MSLLSDLAGSAVTAIRVESALTPPVDIAEPFADASAPPSWLASFMRPTITVNPGQPDAVVIAPYGEGHGERWPLVAALLVVGAYFVLTGLLGLVRTER